MEQEVTKRLPVPNPAARALRCSVIATLKVFATKWKPCILCYLVDGPLRYNELVRIIPSISRRMLSQHLRQLEKDKIVERRSLDRKNQHVEYSLTEKGRSLLPVLEGLQDWGMEHLEGVASIRSVLDEQRAWHPVA